MKRVSDTPLIDTQGDSMNLIRTIRLPTRGPAQRRSEPVPIGVAVAEACADIAARSRKAALRLRTQTGEALRKALATG
jgi:hypothetical protein